MAHKTGTEILGTRLFASMRAHPDMIGKLRSDVDTHLHRLRRAHPHADDAHVKHLVRSAFTFEPLVIHDLTAIRIETFRRDYRNEYDCWMSGHLHEAQVAFRGDPLFWRMKHLDGPDFPYPGKIGAGTVRLRMFVDGEDYHRFKADVESALHSAREMLRITEQSQRLIAEEARGIVEEALDSQAV